MIFGFIQIGLQHWFVFIVIILIAVFLDLGVFHRRTHIVKFKEAFFWTAFWFCLSMGFAFLFVKPYRGDSAFHEFVAGYITELSLSLDNVFVIALIFSYFRVQEQFQHRVLFWGILGALIMRGIMIVLGIALINKFHWILYVLGAFLVYSGIHLAFSEEKAPEPEKNLAIRIARKIFPLTPTFEGQKFFIKNEGKLMMTPMMVVLIMVETTDLIFALDSLPAIFGITTDSFTVFTSNVFAILGLRSLYFVLAGALRYFKYLQYGLMVILVFIGCKMLLPFIQDEFGVLNWLKIEAKDALLVITSIIGVSIIISFISGFLSKKHNE